MLFMQHSSKFNYKSNQLEINTVRKDIYTQCIFLVMFALEIYDAQFPVNTLS